MMISKRNLLVSWSIFRGYVSFREGNIWNFDVGIIRSGVRLEVIDRNDRDHKLAAISPI